MDVESYRNGDLQRLHERIDSLDNKIDDRLNKMAERQTRMAVALGTIETTLKLMPAPPELPDRPCRELSEHLNNHRETRRLWQSPIVGMLIHLFELALVAALTYVIAAALTASEPKSRVGTPPQAKITQPAGDTGLQ